MPGSDSKYSSYTVAERGNGNRRMRGQRRKTDCSDEIQASIRRPSTSHSSSLTSRKVTYSQYPDFETITDPFAKRDKIPQKSIKPVFSGTNGAGGKPPNPDDRSGTTASSSSSSPTLQQPAGKGMATASKADTKGHGIPKENSLRTTHMQIGLSSQRNGVPTKGTQYPNSMSIALRKQQAYAAEPIQMEPLDTSLPGSPAPPVPRHLSDTRCASHVEQFSAQAGGAFPPSPMSQAPQTPSSARTMDMYSSRKESLPPRHIDVKSTTGGTTAGTGAEPALIRPFSGHHLNSPRLDIDMDKVETLYARSSVIFEKNKQRREAKNRADSAIAETNSTTPLSVSAVRNGKHGGLGSTANDRTSSPLARADTKTNKHSNEYNDDYDDDMEGHHEGEDYIPFDQVLIPTAFKRLRAAIDDPDFEMDEETYRRFKLSERWYAREVHAQMERSYAIGTFGKSKDRGRGSRKDHSDNGADALLRDDPSSALDQALYRNGSSGEVDQDIPMVPISPPQRKRTSSRKRSQRSAVSGSGSHYHSQRYQMAGEDVLNMPQAVSPRAKLRPVPRDAHGRNVDSAYVPPQLQSGMRQDSLNYGRTRNDAAALGGHMDPSSHLRHGSPIRHNAHAIRRSDRTDAQHPSEKTSSGCCGCTIM
ncbi:hypothetical protein EV175_002048 [Coemansia sp. RSA 1933]|nr:hypothetical protein EV175_002048 [Coemansia sp. RSA 1933]